MPPPSFPHQTPLCTFHMPPPVFPTKLHYVHSKTEYSYTSTLPKGLRGLEKGKTYLHLF
jgi:hypothetical protein